MADDWSWSIDETPGSGEWGVGSRGGTDPPPNPTPHSLPPTPSLIPVCDACTQRCHWACTGPPCGCDCDPEAVLQALDPERQGLRAAALADGDVPPPDWRLDDDTPGTGAILADGDEPKETP